MRPVRLCGAATVAARFPGDTPGVPEDGVGMVGRIIESDACVAEGAAWLAAREPRFAMALMRTGALPLRRKPDGFAALLDAIIGQQVSVASARAIWARLEVGGTDRMRGDGACR